MKKNTKLYCAAIIGFLLPIFGISHFYILPESKADTHKRVKIENMYLRYQKEFPDIQDVTPREAIELINTGQVVFIDIREPDEQSVSQLPIAITADSFLKDSKKYADHIKISYCTIGYRSGIFAQELGQRGIFIYNLRGGLLAWVHDGGKVYNGAEETRRIHVYGEEWNLAPENYEAIW